MGPENGFQLDETTLYSILGLKYGATDVQVRKAYMKLARQLHPDKSKSEEAGELFKKVAHAHFILTDKKEKMKYDSKLLAKGLYDYTPRTTTNSTQFSETKKPFQPVNKNGDIGSVKQKTRKSRPYEEQPYGFGVDSNRGPSKNIPLFKTFNAKSYQNSKKAATPPREEQSSEQNKRHTSTSHERPTNKLDALGKTYSKEKNTSETGLKSDSRTPSSGSETSTTSASTAGSTEESEAYVQNKMPRKDQNSGAKIRFNGPKAPDSPFQDPARRHFARTKYVSGLQGRRSLSPVKNTPNSSTETLNNVKNIFNSMSDRLRHTLFGENDEGYEDSKESKWKNSRSENDEASGRLFKKSKLPERKIFTDEEIYEYMKQQNESDNYDDPDRQDFNSSIHLNTEHLDDKNELNTQDFRQAPVTDTKIDQAHTTTEMNTQKQKDEEDEDEDDVIKLKELEQTLPNSKEPFDMRNVGDTLDNYKVKRMKVPTYGKRVSSTTSTSASYAEENLQEAVNIPLPRVYKPESIPLENYKIDSSIANIVLPEIPNLLCNVLDRSQVLECQQKTIEFTQQTNETKHKLLQILSQRFTADEMLHEKLYRIENVNNLVAAKRYDMELLAKLNELQNRQRIVAENHANIMNTVYASGLFEASKGAKQ
ncbi:j-protein (type III) [Kluyveromyces marxianus]|nr:j-protein (type III) [Kluyveromyces marxianus]KAG0683955.1 j-protein (type III) [Kluyveromyces marxianus]